MTAGLRHHTDVPCAGKTRARGANEKPKERIGNMAKATVWFSAPGYGSETRKFKSADEARKHIERDAAEIASAHGGEVSDYGNGEWVVTAGGGEEIARWEIL